MSAPQVGILVLDDDAHSQGVLRQMLDSEGWRVRLVPEANRLLKELSTGEWSLVIASVAQTGLDGPIFTVLKELALAPASEGARVRVLFLIPEMTGAQAQMELEAVRLPYVLRPFHLHDFLEKVSDLLLEIHAIEMPIRQVRREFKEDRRKKKKIGRETSMFASRDAYMMTEEEIAEYERSEAEESQKKKKKKINDLGQP